MLARYNREEEGEGRAGESDKLENRSHRRPEKPQHANEAPVGLVSVCSTAQRSILNLAHRLLSRLCSPTLTLAFATGLPTPVISVLVI